MILGIETGTWWIAIFSIVLLNMVLVFSRVNNVKIKQGIAMTTVILGLLLHPPYISMVRRIVPLVSDTFPVCQEFTEIARMLIIVAGILIVIGGIEGIRAIKN